MFFFWNRFPRVPCYNRYNFFVSRSMKNICLPFNWQSSCGFWKWNFVLTLRRHSLAFALYMPVLLRIIINRCGAIGIRIQLILKSTANIYSQIWQIFDPKNQGFPILLLECNVNSESSNNIFYFSDDNPENNEGNNSNSNDNS